MRARYSIFVQSEKEGKKLNKQKTVLKGVNKERAQ